MNVGKNFLWFPFGVTMITVFGIVSIAALVHDPSYHSDAYWLKIGWVVFLATFNWACGFVFSNPNK